MKILIYLIFFEKFSQINHKNIYYSFKSTEFSEKILKKIKNTWNLRFLKFTEDCYLISYERRKR